MANLRLEATPWGLSKIAKALANEEAIEFTKMQFGDGEAAAPAVSLGHLCLTLPVIEVTKGSNYIEAVASFDTSDLESDFTMTEIGLIADDSDDGEQIFAYIHQDLEDAETFHALSSGKLEDTEVSVQIAVDNVQNITLIMPSRQFADKASLDDHIYDYNNPHQVTKEQLGLENAENCKAQDSIIVFTEDTGDLPFESGSSLSTLMGRIARIIAAFKAHLLHTNPHSITPEKIGAAYAFHTHDLLHWGTTPPTETWRLWVDTTPNTGGLKAYRNGEWVGVPVMYT